MIDSPSTWPASCHVIADRHVASSAESSYLRFSSVFYYIPQQTVIILYSEMQAVMYFPY
jgi:hypothetical protein